MSNYLLILAWIVIFSIISGIGNSQRIEIVDGRKVCRLAPIWACLLFLPLVIWSGYRGYVGDTWAYLRTFRNLPSTIGGIPAYMDTTTKDEGFYFLSIIIKIIIGNQENLYLIIMAAIQAILLIKVYRKYSTRYVLTFFLFIASTDYISWMFNGIRQFTAVTITFACFELILKKKYIPTILIILFASSIHGSALIVLPFIFIVQGRAWNKKTLLFVISIILAILFIDSFTNILDTMLVETQYKNVVSDWKSWDDDGTNFFRVLVYSVPAILSLIGRDYIEKEDNNVINLCANMSIIAMGFYIISMFTSGIFIGRLPIYFSLYSYILLPWEIDYIFDEEVSRIVYIVMIIGYLGFYLYSIKSLGII